MLVEAYHQDLPLTLVAAVPAWFAMLNQDAPDAVVLSPISWRPSSWRRPRGIQSLQQSLIGVRVTQVLSPPHRNAPLATEQAEDAARYRSGRVRVMPKSNCMSHAVLVSA